MPLLITREDNLTAANKINHHHIFGLLTGILALIKVRYTLGIVNIIIPKYVIINSTS